MPNIYFKGVVYNRVEDMPPAIRAEYDKAVHMLPDRDANGIPDLLEIEGPPVRPADPVQAPSPLLTPKQAQTANKVIRWAALITVGAIGLMVACLAIFLVGIASLLRSSDAYKLGIQTALENSTVQEVLGTPLKDGFFVTGSISESGASGSAELSVPLSGPEQSGTLTMIATKEEDTWRLDSLVLEVGEKFTQFAETYGFTDSFHKPGGKDW